MWRTISWAMLVGVAIAYPNIAVATTSKSSYYCIDIDPAGLEGSTIRAIHLTLSLAQIVSVGSLPSGWQISIDDYVEPESEFFAFSHQPADVINIAGLSCLIQIAKSVDDTDAKPNIYGYILAESSSNLRKISITNRNIILKRSSGKIAQERSYTYFCLGANFRGEENDKLLGIFLQLASARVVSVPKMPIGWEIEIDNKTEGDATVFGAVHGDVARLGPDEARCLVEIEDLSIDTGMPMSISGKMTIGTTLDEQEIALTANNIVLRAATRSGESAR